MSADCGITDGQPTPDFQPLFTGMLVQMCVGAFLGATGVAVIIAGWDDLSSDLGGSIAPIGGMLIGFCILIVWFSWVRLNAACKAMRMKVDWPELRAHYVYICRFTGGDCRLGVHARSCGRSGSARVIPGEMADLGMATAVPQEHPPA